jgi:hypothetical protein
MKRYENVLGERCESPKRRNTIKYSQKEFSGKEPVFHELPLLGLRFVLR